VMTAIGPSGTFDTGWDGPVAHALRENANAVSARLGR